MTCRGQSRSTLAVYMIQQCAGIEMFLLDLVPWSKDILDLQQFDVGELVLELGRYGWVDDAIAAFGRDALAVGRVQEVEVGLGDIVGAVAIGNLVDNGDREFG